MNMQKIFTWCKSQPATFIFATGSAFMSVGVGIVSGSPGAGVLAFGSALMCMGFVKALSRT